MAPSEHASQVASHGHGHSSIIVIPASRQQTCSDGTITLPKDEQRADHETAGARSDGADDWLAQFDGGNANALALELGGCACRAERRFGNVSLGRPSTVGRLAGSRLVDCR